MTNRVSAQPKQGTRAAEFAIWLRYDVRTIVHSVAFVRRKFWRARPRAAGPVRGGRRLVHALCVPARRFPRSVAAKSISAAVPAHTQLCMWPFAHEDPNFYCIEALLQRDLSGKTFLITGGTSGFGKAVAETLGALGASVVLAVRRLEAGEEVAAAISSKGPGHCRAMSLDLASLASVRAFAHAFTSEYQRLDTLLENAAGVAWTMRPPSTVSNRTSA